MNNNKKGKNFLSVYIIGLFGVALVLILISYVTQLRADTEINKIGNQLSEQVSAAEGANARVEALQATLTEQEKTIKSQNEIIVKYREALDIDKDEDLTEYLEDQTKKGQAMDYIWKIEKKYLSDDIITTKQLIDEMEKLGNDSQLKEYLGDGAYNEYISIKEKISDTETE